MYKLDNFFSNSIKKTITLFCTFLFSIHLSAQVYTQNDSTRIFKMLNRADEEAITGSLDTAMKYANIALQFSKEKKMMRGEGFAKLKVADILFQKEQPVNINEYYEATFQIGAHLKDSFLMALSCYQHGQYIMYEGKFEEAEKLFNKALALKFEKAQSDYTALVYNDMGFLFGLQNELEQQVEWLLKAIRLDEKLQNQDGLATSINNLGGVYDKIGNHSKALEYIKQAASIREKIGDIQGLAIVYSGLSRLFNTISLDSAFKYQELAMKYAEKSGVKSLMISSYDNLSILADKQKNKQEALMYIQKSIALCKELDDKEGLAGKYRWAAILNADLKDTAAMNNYFDESYQLVEQLNNKQLWRDFYGTKANAYTRTGDYKNAYNYLKKYYLYRDSLISSETATNIAELQTKYETEKKDNEISKLLTNEKISQLEIEKQKAIISGNMLVAKQKEDEIKMLSQQQELRDVRIQQQKEALEKQLLIAQNSEQELKLAKQEKLLRINELDKQKQIRNVVIGGAVLLALLSLILFNRFKLKKKLEQQNQLLHVRNDIARDLHDEIGSTLTSIKILSEVSHNNLQKDQQKTASFLNKIKEQSAQMQQGMSDIIWAVKPENDKLENILSRMREYASHTLEPKNILVTFKVDETLLSHFLDMQQRRDFFLIFKEAVNNAAKYSMAKNVTVKIAKKEDHLFLTISDDGVGFVVNNETTSNGLKNMKSRAEALKGTFYIQSEPGKGTTINATIPTT